MRSFKVGGLFDAGMYEFDRGLVFTSFADAALLYHTDGRATGLRLAIRDVYDAREIAMTTAKALANETGVNYYVADWTRLHYTYFRSIQLQKTIMFVILSLVIAVAAFNIVSTLVMAVTRATSRKPLTPTLRRAKRSTCRSTCATTRSADWTGTRKVTAGLV